MIAIAIGMTLVVLARYLLLKREIKRVSQQLRQWNRQATGKKIDIRYYDSALELLAKEINDQIEVARRAAAAQKRTEREWKQAISHISHDIRTPMTSILGYIQLIEGDDLSSEKQAYTETVRKGALRLKALLEDFFELSIIESPDYPIKPESIRLSELVSDVLMSFYEEFHQRKIMPSIDLPEEEVRITGDISAVKRVVENLLMNALRHSGGQVAIRLQPSSDSVRLSIINPAQQLSPQDLPLLFDRFYKADQTRTGKGAGLGLSIAKSLMLKMKGDLTAELHGGKLHMICEWRRGG